MSSDVDPGLYRMQYDTAVKLFDDSQMEASVALSKSNATGLDNWEDADYCSLLQNKDTPQASI
ncbi:hypothetical protein B5807_05465 [Epicoccum nigrum]|uniref:Uncharacterized protein n=1 Tax=Epicoccum nigrum TaxID=105696 RepID=A0A1Y2LZP0_EPING|nr:hypothetical protein B5807_05465 [Epicoccum nigrum]